MTEPSARDWDMARTLDLDPSLGITEAAAYAIADARAEGEAKGRREAALACAKIAVPSKSFEETVAANRDIYAISVSSVVRKEIRDIQKQILALTEPASDVDRIERDGILFREGEAKGRREAIEKCTEIVRSYATPRNGVFLARHPMAVLDGIADQFSALAEPADGSEK